MMDDKLKYFIALLAVVGIFALPFIINPNAKFGGADDAGSKAIAVQQPGYKPWFSSFFKPPPETESMLFALQAAMGAIVIGYFIGYEMGRKENKGKNKKTKLAPARCQSEPSLWQTSAPKRRSRYPAPSRKSGGDKK